jgi:ABC-type iron transport system FetAB permease component
MDLASIFALVFVILAVVGVMWISTTKIRVRLPRPRRGAFWAIVLMVLTLEIGEVVWEPIKLLAFVFMGIAVAIMRGERIKVERRDSESF